jgi:uncharacterized repeat protein (TIGR03806 family)
MIGAFFAALSLAFNSQSGIAQANFPDRLSETGLFRSLNPPVASPRLIPYEINQAFWSDGADKKRWMLLPDGAQIGFSAAGEWTFPTGTLFVKQFSLEQHPVETRLLLLTGTNVMGASYQWRDGQSDAVLLITNLLAKIKGRNGSRPWYFPSSEDCRVCHNANAGFVLGVSTRQLNRQISNEAKGRNDNQLVLLSEKGVFKAAVKAEELKHYAALPTVDAAVPLERAARAYLDVNCAFCHRPGGAPGYIDARYETPLAKQNLVGGPLFFDQGIDGARVIAPHDPWRSMLLMRIQTVEELKMPPLARCTVDERAVKLMRDWIASMPGEEVLQPPAIHTRTNGHGVEVVLSASSLGATLRYTTNGLPPGKHSPIYSSPFPLSPPETVRARAYKDGFTRSIAVQRTFTAP